MALPSPSAALAANAGSAGSIRRNSLAALRNLAQPRRPLERCELCCAPLAPEHRHLLQMAENKIVCSCDPCALRFQGVVDGHFKLIPRDARLLADFQLSDVDWEALSLPINLVFIFHSSRAAKFLAMYPSPAGATESLLPLANWAALVEKNRPLASMEPDVEALLVNRVGEARDYFIAPIDRCFELVGLIRSHWRGLSGGDAVWEEIERFFARLRERSEVVRSEAPEVAHA